LFYKQTKKKKFEKEKTNSKNITLTASQIMFRYGLLSPSVVGFLHKAPLACQKLTANLGFHGFIVIDGQAQFKSPLLQPIEHVGETTSVFKIQHWSCFALLKCDNGDKTKVGLKAYHFECSEAESLFRGVCDLTHQKCPKSNLYLIAGMAPLKLLLFPRGPQAH